MPATLADGQWHFLLSRGGQVVLAGLQLQRANLGSFSTEVQRADPNAAVRHAQGATTLQVKLCREGRYFVPEVLDDGPLLLPAALAWACAAWLPAPSPEWHARYQPAGE